MSMSLDADIMYGMVLWDSENTFVEVPWREEDEIDFEDWVCQQLGLEPLDYSTYPEERYDRRVETYDVYSARQKVLSEEWGKRVGRDAYYAKKRELLATVPVEEDWGGTEDARSTILRLGVAHQVQAYYYPQAFDPEELALTPADKLRDKEAFDFLAKYGVTWEPKWLLVPSYG